MASPISDAGPQPSATRRSRGLRLPFTTRANHSRSEQARAGAPPSPDLLSETVEGLDTAIRRAREQVAADPLLQQMSKDLDRLICADEDRELESHAA